MRRRDYTFTSGTLGTEPRPLGGLPPPSPFGPGGFSLSERLTKRRSAEFDPFTECAALRGRTASGYMQECTKRLPHSVYDDLRCAG